jgi:hypothetical protein
MLHLLSLLSKRLILTFNINPFKIKAILFAF